MLKKIILFFALGWPMTSYGLALQFGTENTLHGQGFVDINIKNRTYIMFGAGDLYVGPVVYWQRPYEGFQELIYGIGLRYGQKIAVGVDIGYAEREVFEKQIKGLAAALVVNYELSKHWYLSVPVVYRDLDDGDLAKRIEVSVLPYIGVKFGL